MLNELSHKYSDIWKMVDLFQQGRGKDLPDWPEWCFLPASAAYQIVAYSLGVERVTFEHKEKLMDIAAISALAAWRVTKGIYIFDKTLQDSLISTPISGDIPHEILFRVPEWCVYIGTPGLQYINAPLYGFFAHLESDANTGRVELRLLLDTEKGLFPIPLHLGAWGLEESVSRFMAECYKQGMPRDDNMHIDAAKSMASLVSPLVSLLLYLCSQNAEIGDGSRVPQNPEPKKTKRGIRIFQVEKPTMWDVGVRIGAAIRRAQAVEREPTETTGTHASPRSHIRRAHWHSFWIGPRAEVDARKIMLKWLPPIPINVDDIDGLPATIKKIL